MEERSLCEKEASQHLTAPAYATFCPALGGRSGGGAAPRLKEAPAGWELAVVTRVPPTFPC